MEESLFEDIVVGVSLVEGIGCVCMRLLLMGANFAECRIGSSRCTSWAGVIVRTGAGLKSEGRST